MGGHEGGMMENMEEDKYLDGVCCGFCAKFERRECPVKGASPWSRWQNWCSEYEPDPAQIEAKTIEEGVIRKRLGEL
jgi:hypothetical protein